MAELGQVGFYTPQDLYYYATDNRPIQDLQNNIELVANQLDNLWGLIQAIPCVDTSAVANYVDISTNTLNSPTPNNGQIFAVSLANTCTGPTVLTLNGSISGEVLSNGANLQGGELAAGAVSLILYDSGNWFLFSQNSGSFQLNEGSQFSNLVTQAQLGSGSLPASLGPTQVVDTTVNGSAAFSSTLSVSPGASGGELVNLGQIINGFASQVSLINWTGVASDTVLEPGQTAYYNFNNMTTADMPLHISCADYQIYEVTMVSLSYSSSGLGLGLMPNNTNYSGQFGFTSMETSYTNQGQFYAPTSSTVQYGLSMDSGTGDLFYFDDVGGACLAPFIRTLKVWTGVTSSSPIQAPTIMAYGGGGLSGSGTGEVPGVDMGTSTWQGNPGTAWTSLGTFVQTTFSAGNTYSNLVLVKRII